MNKYFILISTFLLFVPAAYPKDLEISKSAGRYQVEVRIHRNPPILGDNDIEIEIKDTGGNPVTDARILVNYYMPPMPRMAPMSYKIKAKLKGEKYRATMNLIMSGPWIIRIIITRKKKRAVAKFNIDAQ